MSGQLRVIDKTERAVDLHQQRVAEIVIETIAEQESDEQVTTTVREYDTRLPVDTLTGTPPLMRETTQHRRKVEQGRQAQTETHKEEGITTEHTEATRQTEAIVQVDAGQQRGMNPIQAGLCFLGGIALLCVLCWLGIKIVKRHFITH